MNRKARAPLAQAPPELRLKAKFFRGLADLSRLSILEALKAGRKSVSEVVKSTGLSQPNASMHLNCLWECGLVEREVGRRYTLYWIRSEEVTRLLAIGQDLLESVRDRIASCTRYEEKGLCSEEEEK